jgi:hypothetical protein
MFDGVSTKMHEANPLDEVRDRVQGGNDLEKAIESDR